MLRQAQLTVEAQVLLLWVTRMVELLHFCTLQGQAEVSWLQAHPRQTSAASSSAVELHHRASLSHVQGCSPSVRALSIPARRVA